jgi:hypothetical protein
VKKKKRIAKLTEGYARAMQERNQSRQAFEGVLKELIAEKQRVLELEQLLREAMTREQMRMSKRR